MLKFVSGLLIAFVAGWLLVGSTTTASAHYRHHAGCCGPIPPTYVYKTAHKVTHVTRYRDVSRTRYVYQPHRIIHVTRVRPIIYVHTVTRIHHHTIGIVRPVYEHVTEYLRPRRIMTASVVSTYDCRCYHHCH